VQLEYTALQAVGKWSFFAFGEGIDTIIIITIQKWIGKKENKTA
jgi:hypothetical protein